MASEETKKILAKSLIELLEEQPIEKITIQEIVDKSGFNRQTFYYHFTDIFDLLAWILRQKFDMLSKSELSKMDENIPEKINRAFDFLLENKMIILHSYNPNRRYYYEQIMRPWIMEQLTKMLESHPRANEISSEEKEFITGSFTWVFLGLIFEWLERGMFKQSRDIIEDYYLLIRVSMEASIEAFADRRKERRKEE